MVYPRSGSADGVYRVLLCDRYQYSIWYETPRILVLFLSVSLWGRLVTTVMVSFDESVIWRIVSKSCDMDRQNRVDSASCFTPPPPRHIEARQRKDRKSWGGQSCDDDVALEQRVRQQQRCGEEH